MAEEGDGCWAFSARRTARAMVRSLLGDSDVAGIVPVRGHSSWSVEELLEAPAAVQAAGLNRFESPSSAGLPWLCLRSSGDLPVVAGSLVLLGEVIPQLDPTN
jgi:hypothetical protein